MASLPDKIRTHYIFTFKNGRKIELTSEEYRYSGMLHNWMMGNEQFIRVNYSEGHFEYVNPDVIESIDIKHLGDV